MRILIPDAPFTDDAAVERRESGPAVAFDVFRKTALAAIPAELWQACDGVICFSEANLDAEAVARLERCRIIVRAGVGFDNVDVAAAGRRGILVCNVPDYGTADVADHAMALMLALARGIPAFDSRLRAEGREGWRFDGLPVVRRMTGLVFGAVGLGRIGVATALRARAFGMPVLFYDPYLKSGIEVALGFGRMGSLADLVHRADVLSLHVPLIDETRGMIGGDMLRLAKPGQILINTARGAVLDLDALFEALQGGRLAAAALDVLPQEPPDFTHPLLAAWRAGEPWLAGRFLLTPHCAFYSPSSIADLRRKAAGTAMAYLRGGLVLNAVNQDILRTREGTPSAAV